MSPKSSRNGSISRPSSVHTHAPGSDGDRGHDQAVTPSPAGIESNACSPESPQEAAPTYRGVAHIDRLGYTFDRLTALSHAMFAVVFTQGEFWRTQDMPTDDMLALSELSEELCQEARGHVDALWQHIRAREGKGGSHA